MKTYEQAIKSLADHKYHNIMGGGSGRIDVGWIAWVFEKAASQVYKDVDTYLRKVRGWK